MSCYLTELSRCARTRITRNSLRSSRKPLHPTTRMRQQGLQPTQCCCV